METTIRINTDALNMDILEGIKKMFPHKQVEITVQEKYHFTEVSDDDIRNSPGYIKGDEDATQYILNRPALAARLQESIESIENGTAELISVKVEELL